MKNLNENERRALDVIIETCDDLDGDLFTRLQDIVLALIKEFGDGHAVGGYITQLQKKGFIDFDDDDGYGVGIWVNA